MSEEFAKEVVARLRARCIAAEQGGGSGGCCGKSQLAAFDRHAFETLLDIETLMFEATALLNAASIVNRSNREEHRSG